jgi:DNA-binding transcriptional regulator YdaS (Cro superfamily)
MSRSALENAMGELSQTAFAERIGNGASQQLVSYWMKTGRVGGGYVLAVEAATGISRHELRPDIFGVEPSQAAA